MHGFYANLLTKNIAMGSDVSTSAVSAYTAGSERMKMRLGEEDPSPPLEDPETNTSKRMLDKEDPSDEIKEKKIKLQESSPSVPEPVPAVPIVEAAPAPPVQPSAAPSEPQKTKEEIILSAKERYLKRKQQQQQNAP